jgi:hypothetical protein
MAIDERSRHALHAKLEELLGPQEAATLMEHLPPVGWADVATKRDLDQTATLIEAKMDVLEQRVRVDVRAQIVSAERHFVTWLLGANLTLAGLAFAAARLF